MKDYEFRMRVATAITQMRDRDPFFEDRPEYELAQRLEKELKTMRSMDKYHKQMAQNRIDRRAVC